jgi:N6-adenosine-specific RNA methylase IME4
MQNRFLSSAHRSKNYDTLDIYTLFDIPMSKLLSSEALVAVWVTNRPKYKQFLIDKLFPSWQLELVGEWYWLKMTTTGQPVMPLDSTHRKPYELLLVARNKASTSAIHVPEKLVFASVASQHSRKPPLNGKIPGPFFFPQ